MCPIPIVALSIAVICGAVFIVQRLAAASRHMDQAYRDAERFALGPTRYHAGPRQEDLR